MKILIVTQYFWPELFRINDLALWLQERGHDVVVLTGIPNYPRGKFFSGYNFFGPRCEKLHGIKIVRVPLIPRGQKRPWQLAINYFSFVFFGSILGVFYCRGKFDCIFVPQLSPITLAIPAIILKKIKNIPLLLWVQDLWPESLSAAGAVRSQWILRFIAPLVRWVYKNSDRILVQSRSFISSVKVMGAGEEKIFYLPNWAEDLYRPIVLPDAAQEREEIPKGFIVMFAGNIGAAQDFETILAAAERLPRNSDIHFVILGDGRMRSWVEEQIRQRDLQHIFHLLGSYPTEAMPRYFALADAMLVTLKREPIFVLTIPGKIQSYLACGKPIIAAIDGEGARVVEEANAGIACGAEDPGALADAILALRAMNMDQRRSLGMNGRAYFEKHFDRNMLCNQLEEWMRECIAVRNAA